MVSFYSSYFTSCCNSYCMSIHISNIPCTIHRALETPRPWLAATSTTLKRWQWSCHHQYDDDDQHQRWLAPPPAWWWWQSAIVPAWHRPHTVSPTASATTILMMTTTREFQGSTPIPTPTTPPPLHPRVGVIPVSVRVLTPQGLTPGCGTYPLITQYRFTIYSLLFTIQDRVATSPSSLSYSHCHQCHLSCAGAGVGSVINSVIITALLQVAGGAGGIFIVMLAWMIL